MISQPRRAVLAASLAGMAGSLSGALSSFVARPSFAQSSYPNRPITMIVPQPPGGAADVFGRQISNALGARLGSTVIVENKAGANGNIAAAYVAHAPNDGYTLFFGSISIFCVNPHLYRSPGFDPLKDFQTVTLANQTPNVLVVNAATPYRSVADVVAAAKAKPGTLSFGSAGNGNTMHLAGLEFQSSTGISLIHVPYKGGPAALADVMSGQIPMMFHNLSAVYTLHKAGRVRILAVCDHKRSPFVPEVPTMAEAGAPGVISSAWAGVVMPAGAPADIVRRLNNELRAILETPSFRKPLEDQAFEVLSSTPEEFAARMKTDYDSMGRVIKAGNVTVD